MRCAHPRGELQQDEELETSGVGLSVFPIDSCSTNGAWCILSWAAGQLHSMHIALLSPVRMLRVRITSGSLVQWVPLPRVLPLVIVLLQAGGSTQGSGLALKGK